MQSPYIYFPTDFWKSSQIVEINTLTKKVVFCLFGFYGISTFVGYLMPNQFLYK